MTSPIDALPSKGEGKPAFTPGPWRECRNGQCDCGTVWSIPGDFPVCTAAGDSNFPVAVAHEHMADAPDLIYQSMTPAECEANARLIAAAPDLYAALAECADDLAAEIETRYPAEVRHQYPSEARRYERDMEPVRKARAALSLARGEPSNG